MGFRFFRRLHICPGLSVNLSRSGPSFSVGVRGAHVTVGRRGVTRTIGLPGTGLFYTSRQGLHSGYHSAASDVPRTLAEHATARQRVELMFALLFVAVIATIVLYAAK